MERVNSKFHIGDYVQATVYRPGEVRQILGRIIEVWRRKSRYPDTDEKVYYKIDNYNYHIPEENIEEYQP